MKYAQVKIRGENFGFTGIKRSTFDRMLEIFGRVVKEKSRVDYAVILIDATETRFTPALKSNSTSQK